MELDINENCEKIHKELVSEISKLDDFSNLEHSEKVSELFLTLYRNSLKENYYWQFCPFKVFQSNFEIEFANFKRDQIDEPDFVFYQKMIQQVFDNTGKKNRRLSFPKATNIFFDSLSTQEYDEEYYFTFFEDGIFFPTNILLNALLDSEIIKNIEFTQQKKIDFIISKYYETDILTALESKKTEQPEIFLDYSDNTAAEKIVFLHELGILEFLMKKEPFNTSTNKLAEVVTAFTGIGLTTTQPYLNPIYSKQVDQKNNPLTEKNIKTVTEKLIKMGFIRK
jgi:hypothetical protein